jgi:hypothetical protein
MLKRLTLLVGLLGLLMTLGVPSPAHATPGMCTITGTVYNMDGTAAAGGTVIFRQTFTQVAGSGDAVQVSAEYVTLDGSGNIPAGTQVPLGARLDIQVNRDKPVNVVVTSNSANCPQTFGALYGSGISGGPVVPSTVVTSITTVNSMNGVTLSATNPVGAGAATLTLSNGTSNTWTPTITATTTNPTVTYTAQVGHYQELGNLYWFNLFVAWSAFSGGVGNAQISGFPLTQNSATQFFVGGPSWDWGGLTLTANYTSLGCQISPGGSIITLVQSGTAGVAVANLNAATAFGAAGQILCQGWGSL